MCTVQLYRHKFLLYMQVLTGCQLRTLDGMYIHVERVYTTRHHETNLYDKYLRNVNYGVSDYVNALRTTQLTSPKSSKNV